MFSPDIFINGKKLNSIYESFCTPICKEYNINKSTLDVILFLANHPDLNSARNLCEIRGLKKGIASIVIEYLNKNGYLTRECDPSDRRIQRLFLTNKCDPIVKDGLAMQQLFIASLTADFTEEELRIYQKLLQKISKRINEMGDSLCC